MSRPNYLKSIRAIEQAESHYYQMCGEYGEDDGAAIEAFIEFHELKKEHRATFGSLCRINGQWV